MSADVDSEGMPLGKHGKPLKVTVSPKGEGYQIIWIDPATGKRRQTSRHTEHEARKLQAEIIEKMKAGALKRRESLNLSVDPSLGDIEYWKTALRLIMSSLFADPGNDELHRMGMSAAKLASAVRPFIEISESESRLNGLEELVTKLRRGEKYGLANPFVQGAPPAH